MILKILANKNILLQTKELNKSFQEATPFSHVVIDNFLERNFADLLHDETRSILKEINVSNDFTQKNKIACNDWSKFGRTTFDFISFLNSSIFVNYLESITSFKGLITDPLLEGGGIHSVSNNGFLKMHSDFNWHNYLKIFRRINILFYLNKNWKESMKGELILSSKNIKDYVSIKPLFNRLVIFNTNDKTFHGHPEKLNFPDELQLCVTFLTGIKFIAKCLSDIGQVIVVEHAIFHLDFLINIILYLINFYFSSETTSSSIV